jgi:hypothetical protein
VQEHGSTGEEEEKEGPSPAVLTFPDQPPAHARSDDEKEEHGRHLIVELAFSDRLSSGASSAPTRPQSFRAQRDHPGFVLQELVKCKGLLAVVPLDAHRPRSRVVYSTGPAGPYEEFGIAVLVTADNLPPVCDDFPSEGMMVAAGIAHRADATAEAARAVSAQALRRARMVRWEFFTVALMLLGLCATLFLKPALIESPVMLLGIALTVFLAALLVAKYAFLVLRIRRSPPLQP